VEGDRWLEPMAAIDPRLPTDPHWGALCACLDRIQADGRDVAAMLAWVTHDQPLYRRPGRTLEDRLTIAGARPSRRHDPDPRPAPRPSVPEPVRRPDPYYDWSGDAFPDRPT